MACAGQCHIPKPQVFAQAVGIGALHILRSELQLVVPLALSIGQAQDRGLVGPHHTVAVRKWQAHHRVLQALAGVDGHHLHQVFVAFQAHGLLVALGVFIHLLHQPADQRLLAIESHAGRLQQLGQVQHIGQAPFALCLTAPTRRQIQRMQ